MSGKSSSLYILLIATILVLFLCSFIVKILFFSPEDQANEVVDEFYRYEQEGEFAKSWNLFHSFMKEKFDKGFYIQDRAHVFMNHFGVQTFDYTLGKPEKMKNWKMDQESSSMKIVYKIPVTQTFKSKYGNFHLQQDVFVGKEKNEWKILWDYNR
jgi:phenylpropionate dioxygenase-like ring-hydroxylating dioxygenase large terminal subunit